MIKQPFILESKFQPAGDQPFAIQQLIEGFQNKQEQILLVLLVLEKQKFT